jgi:hypothetical protein
MNKPLIWASALALSQTLAACSADSDGTSSTTASPASSATPTTPSPTSTPAAEPANGETDIVITAGDQTITATLNDSQVSRDFIATLPVNLSWFRNLDIEFITELDAPLTETGPFYTDVQPGDLVYYNPLDSITIIYEETGSVPTLTKMGEITSDLDVFKDLPDNIDMRIEIA